MPDFLFEIGLEEVPARMIASAEAELAHHVLALLERERLIAAGTVAKRSSTPRRLAVHIAGVAERQNEIAEELTGPSLKIAYKDGMPTPAAHAFAKKAGVPVESLRTVDTPRGTYVTATVLRPGRAASEILVESLGKELASIYWAKSMYWRQGKPERFVRPVRWMVALLDEEIVPIQFAGHTASNLTYGHRVLFGNKPIALSTPGEYASTLESAFVLADVESRRQLIRKKLDQVCRILPGTRWREDHGLVDKLTHLTEWPSVIAGNFDREFLTLPEEILVTVMRDHQSYFAVEGSNGKLAPHFLAVLNTVAIAKGEAVIRHGNERVLRARFNDARFFWEFDQRVSLVDRISLLEHVTFQKDLGSYAAKTKRVSELSERLALLVQNRGVLLDFNALLEAARLAKVDLTTELVKEFTELQGIVGGLYAREQGLSHLTAEAIAEQYLPQSMEDAVPRTIEGQLLAIADKADTVAGMFSLGLEPTGSKDPFALRRAANGIVKILAETGVPLTLPEIIKASSSEMTGWGSDLQDRILTFLKERVEFFLREVRGQAYDVVKAVLSVAADDVQDVLARAEALTAVRGSEDFLAVSAAFKRIKNILDQAADKGYQTGRDNDLSLLPAEIELDQAFQSIEERIKDFASLRNYIPAFEAIATLRPQVDRYFETVMVLDPDPLIRANRLALLSSLVYSVRKIADLSEIVQA